MSDEPEIFTCRCGQRVFAVVLSTSAIRAVVHDGPDGAPCVLPPWLDLVRCGGCGEIVEGFDKYPKAHDCRRRHRR